MQGDNGQRKELSEGIVQLCKGKVVQGIVVSGPDVPETVGHETVIQM